MKNKRLIIQTNEDSGEVFLSDTQIQITKSESGLVHKTNEAKSYITSDQMKRKPAHRY